MTGVRGQKDIGQKTEVRGHEVRRQKADAGNQKTDSR
jgi:hypothetical protein